MRFAQSRWAVLPIGLALSGCSGELPPEPGPPLEPPIVPAAIAMVSGDQQDGKAGEQLGEPFVVRAEDAQGNEVVNVPVTWRVTSGAGDVFRLTSEGYLESVTSTLTGPGGLAQVTFRPTVLGPSTVTASGGPNGPSATFTIGATALVISNGFWGRFLGPNGSRDVTVPVGTTVEWLNYYSTFTAHIVSTTTPPSGASFDSGPLNLNDRFSFVPGVAGTWEYTWYYGEHPDDRTTAKLTAQ